MKQPLSSDCSPGSLEIKMKFCLVTILFIIGLNLKAITVPKNSAMEKEDLEIDNESPRIVEIEFLIDDRRWKDYQKKYGQSPMDDINKEIDQVLKDASIHLAKLDKGGYQLHLHKPVWLLKNSQFKLGSTFRDRRNNNKTTKLLRTDIVGYAFAFQDTVSEMLSRGWKTQPNIVRYILASAYTNCDTGEVCPVGGLRPNAASEEFCLCNPSTFPCIGIFTETEYELPESVLLAHEIGHTLGVYPHDTEPGVNRCIDMSHIATGLDRHGSIHH